MGENPKAPAPKEMVDLEVYFLLGILGILGVEEAKIKKLFVSPHFTYP